MTSPSSPRLSTSFIQLNLGKRLAATTALFKELQTNEICLLQEPPTRKGNIANVPKSHKQFVPFSADRPRVAMILPKDLAKQTMVLGPFSSSDSIVTRSKIDQSQSTMFGSIYMDINKDLPTSLLNRVAEHAGKEQLPLVLAVDSNAHLVAWGHRSSNRRGRELLQVINSNNLVICNIGNAPTFVGSRGHSCIDLTICNRLGLNLLQKWRVDPGKSLSDHEAIRFNLTLGTVSSFATRSPAKCDWDLYEQLITTTFDSHPFWFKPVRNQADLDARQEFISNTLLRCYETACPLTIGTRRSTVPWWNADLTKAKQSAKLLRRKANRTRNNQDWELYREANKRYTRLIQQAKRANWKDFTNSVNSTPVMARIHKVLGNNSRQGSLNSLRKADGTLTSSPEELSLIHI